MPTDAQFLDYMLNPLLPDYVSCERCGLSRQVNTGRATKLCKSCELAGDGARVLEVDEPTPCYQSQDFWNLEGWAEGGLSTIGPGSPKRDNLIREIEQAANGKFCGTCPIKAECLAWGQEEGYTGIAGGRWLRRGTVNDFRPPRLLSLGKSAADMYAELRARGEPLPVCNCHDEQMRWRKKGNRGSWVCMVRERERATRGRELRRERKAA